MALEDQDKLDEFSRDSYAADGLFDALDVLMESYNRVHDEKGWTRKDCAERIGMDPAQFSRILNGRQRNLTVRKFALMLRAMDHRQKLDSEPCWLLEAPVTNEPRFEYSVYFGAASPTATTISGKDRIDVDKTAFLEAAE